MDTDIIVMGAKGRMGKCIAELVLQAKDLTLKAVLEHEDTQGLETFPCTNSTDLDSVLPACQEAVIIDFTAPQASLEHARKAAKYNNPMVIGTTGFNDEEKLLLTDLAKDTPLFWAPNMSVGINALLQTLPALVEKLGEAYDLEMMEIHHNQKKDAPSGTALILAQCLAEAKKWDLKETAACCREGIIGARPQKEIGIQTLRGGDVVGVHTVYFLGPGERVEVTHQAHSRETFAQGSLRAARWLCKQQPGKLYAMSDMM